MDSHQQRIHRLERRLERERRARREAEDIAERTTSILYDRQRELELLEAVAVACNEASTLDEALRVAIDRICGHAGWPVGHAYLVTAPDGELVSARIWHLDDPVAFAGFRRLTEATPFAAGEGLPGRVVAAGEPIWLEDAMRDACFPRRHGLQGGRVHGAFAFPVLVGTEAVAVIEIFNDQPSELDPGLLSVAAHVGA